MTTQPTLTPDQRKAAWDRFIAKGFALRLPDGPVVLTEIGRDAADHAREERR